MAKSWLPVTVCFAKSKVRLALGSPEGWFGKRTQESWLKGWGGGVSRPAQVLGKASCQEAQEASTPGPPPPPAVPGWVASSSQPSASRALTAGGGGEGVCTRGGLPGTSEDRASCIISGAPCEMEMWAPCSEVLKTLGWGTWNAIRSRGPFEHRVLLGPGSCCNKPGGLKCQECAPHCPGA